VVFIRPHQFNKAITSGRVTRSAVWWEFEVACAEAARAPTEGPAPSYAPREGDISPSEPFFESHPLNTFLLRRLLVYHSG
jgi:hypothetical protein